MKLTTNYQELNRFFFQYASASSVQSLHSHEKQKQNPASLDVTKQGEKNQIAVSTPILFLKEHSGPY
jgi:hypothetical protein